MVVFDGAARSPAYFFNEKVMCGLGTGIGESGVLHPAGRTRALAALKRFAMLAVDMGVSPLTAVATAAVREASDGAEFRAEVEAETGIRLWVVDGREEARLSAQGVMLGWPGAAGVICDIGGASMELATIGDGRIGKRVTTPLGPLRLQGLGGKDTDSARKARLAEIDRALSTALDEVGTGHGRLFLVGGSWRAIARLDMERRGYPLRVLHEYLVTSRRCAPLPASGRNGWRWCPSRWRCSSGWSPGWTRPTSPCRATASARGCCTSRCPSACATAIR
jgi:exopolyphosphatase/guanosine-5'-triphosphate,3'-diphosphate pyrophosphatase